MRAAIFDLDGTLADTAGDLIAAANACLAAQGVEPLDARRDRATAYLGGRAMLHLGLSRAGRDPAPLVEPLYAELLVHYEREICRHTTLFPGVEAALGDLAAAGWGLGVCTNKPVALAERLLEALGLGARFGIVVGAGSYPERKPHPRPLLATAAALGAEPARSLLLGDTVTDRDAARAAGTRLALVTFGPEGEGVVALEPDALLPAYAELPALAERLVPRG